MTRQLLSLLLAATQFASWGASPLYLCVGRGGTVSIDQGRERCNSCHDSDDCGALCHAACDRSIGHAHEDDEACPADCDRPVYSDPCGCAHYLIVQQQGPVVVRGPEGAGNPIPAGRLIPSDGSDWAVERLPGFDLALHPPGWRSNIPTGSRAPAQVVLRC